MTIKSCAYAAGIAASLVLLAACGEEVTKVTEVSEKASLDKVEKFKNLPKCNEEAEGSLVYVKDSAKVFSCDGENWVQLNGKDGSDGKDGKNGAAGKDGKDGKDGENGENGSATSCTVTAAKDGNFDVKCDGKTVGSIKSGKDGKTGTAGTGCTAKDTKDGYEIVCDGKTIGTIKNGKDGKDAENGDNCSLKQGENGEVTVKCGDKSATLFSATCGSGPYDPETQICSNTHDENGLYIKVPVTRCKDWSEVYSWTSSSDDLSDITYDPQEMFCDEKSVMHYFCTWVDDEGNTVRKSYAWNEYCDAENKKISKKVPCAEGSSYMRKPTQYCYTTNNDTTVRFADLETCGSGNNEKKYSPVTEFCKRNQSGLLGKKDICAKNVNKADPFNIDIRYMAEESADDHTSQICDTRDYQIYNVVTDNGKTWMTQNLNYRRESVGKDGQVQVQPTAHLDSSSLCYGDDGKDNRGNCSYGRFYLWSAAIDSASLDADGVYCGYGAAECPLPDETSTSTEVVRGICPEGWHLPSKAELENYPKSYMLNANSVKGLFNVTFNGESETVGWVSNSSFFLWSATQKSGKPSNAYGWSSTASGNVVDDKKSSMLPIRCIKDSEATAPAGE